MISYQPTIDAIVQVCSAAGVPENYAYDFAFEYVKELLQVGYSDTYIAFKLDADRDQIVQSCVNKWGAGTGDDQ